jgi:isopentenyl diphosphate isomerase/L-lactate dehydrogenase-like FMN-dependent dehydrogenase
VIANIIAELDLTMALSGVSAVSEIDKDCLA